MIITAGSAVQVNNGQTLVAEGTITDQGKIDLNASDGNGAHLVIGANGNAGTVTVASGAAIVLSDYGYNDIHSDVAGSVLDNYGTISGAGTVGAGSGLTLTNEAGGTIDAIGISGLTLSPTSMSNLGTLQASTGSTLNVQDDSGQFTNLSSGTLTGGMYVVDAGGTISFNGSGATPITTLAADVELSGPSFLQTNNGPTTTIEASLTTINSGGVLALSAHNGTWSNAISDDGTLALVDDVFTNANGLTIDSSGTLVGLWYGRRECRQ